MLGDGKGGFVLSSSVPLPANTGPVSVAMGDFNGDQHPDLVTANQNTSGATVLLGDGLGAFKISPPSPLPAGSFPLGVAVGDFNLDKKPDFAISNSSGNTVTVHLNQSQ